ncbi:MAG: hydroxymethylbilane synthase, partial [Solirubrobacteraceae bacterium]
SEGQFDAIVLALAGLERLGRAEEAGGLLDELVPAAGQGALAIEGRAGAVPPDLLAPVSDADATACVMTERELVGALDASCNTPIGAHARLLGDGGLELVAWVGLPDGSEWIRDSQTGEAGGLGQAVAQRLLSAGAGELLQRAEREASVV